MNMISIAAMVRQQVMREVVMLQLLIAFTLLLLSKGIAVPGPHSKRLIKNSPPPFADMAVASYCLSWRLAVEANNMRGWRTIPTPCWRHIEAYMVGGQYGRDVNTAVEQIYGYVESIPVFGGGGGDGMDAWILDVDDTCLSNLLYYQQKRFGCDPYDPMGFRAWALRGECPAIPAVLELFHRLIEAGFKVILLTGRDEETLGQATIYNLQTQGFVGYERLIMRSAEYRGQSSITYKSEMRKQLEEEGYRIWGNVGDQWSDLQGFSSGNRTFKLPNPMYFVP